MTVKSVMDNLVTELDEILNERELVSLTESKILSYLSDSEIKVLAQEHWKFNVNVPVVVFVMQDKDQKIIPFWLKENKFTNTNLVVKNEYSEYRVWQKEFASGTVNLGINGFDKHRPHYFVAVKAKSNSDELILSNHYPDNQYVVEMKVGAFTYHDWDELVLTDVPKEIIGSKLLTTIRGRAREAHLINAFRKTKFPSSSKPDQIVLTWSKDPATTQSIQWRTNDQVQNCKVRYWNGNSDSKKDYYELNAKIEKLEDRLLLNDRYVHRYSVTIENLEPNIEYSYQVGSTDNMNWSDVKKFSTSEKNDTDFSFVYFGDTHKSPHWGSLINQAFKRFPKTDFYTIGGDLVSTGLYRDDWDQLFEYSKEVISNRPLMPTIGNHDSQDGLGSLLYRQLFELPENSPKKLPKETTYSFQYGNALFLMLDVTLPIEDQTLWLEGQLKNSSSTWKFAIFHFPPFCYEEDYKLIRDEWGTLFDKYHVDMVFSGHVHYYMRTKPMYNEKPVKSNANGTTYVISIAVPNGKREMPQKEYVDVRFSGEHLYQTISIKNNKLTYKAYNSQGDERDQLTIVK